MKTFIKKSLLALAAVSALGTSAPAAITINWGSAAFSTFYNSAGSVLTDGVDASGNPVAEATYTFRLGAFSLWDDPDDLTGDLVTFVPTMDNIQLWDDYWRTFDQAAYSEINGYFTGTADILADGTTSSPDATGDSDTFVFEGLNAYLWVANDPVYQQTLEWAMLRPDTGWTFPTAAELAAAEADCCGGTLPLDWSTSDLVSKTPVMGSQKNYDGGGSYTVDPLSEFAIQTYGLPLGAEVVPETSTIPGMVLLILFTGFHRTRSVRR